MSGNVMHDTGTDTPQEHPMDARHLANAAAYLTAMSTLELIALAGEVAEENDDMDRNTNLALIGAEIAHRGDDRADNAMRGYRGEFGPSDFNDPAVVADFGLFVATEV